MTYTYKTLGYNMPLQNIADTLSNFKEKPRDFFPQKFAATTLLFATVLTSQTYDDNNLRKAFPTAYTLSSMPISSNSIAAIEESFKFENRNEVINFIKERPDVLNLYKSLPVLIRNVISNSEICLSVFRDVEENWSNLRVEIKSDHDIDKLSAFEDEFFKLLKKNKSFISALDYVTISFG